MLMMSIHIAVFVSLWGCDRDVGSVNTSTNTWKSTQIQELLSQPGTIIWPMDELTAEAKNEIGNFVDAPVNSVSTDMMAIPDDVVETIRPKEVKKELNLLTR